MDSRLLFPNNYLGAPDLHEKDVTLTISRLAREKLRTNEGDENKWILYFQEMEDRARKDPDKINKRMVLNKTNAEMIARTTGQSDTDNWPGQKITLYPTTCQAFGSTVDCIRVRP